MLIELILITDCTAPAVCFFWRRISMARAKGFFVF